ncbi:MarR family winged helix-turn-helix transcriptional regulator [Clostridium ganghwense]|uniref:MarR family transcriptional regulator n=1 Tax=Clostridium ganghwense TaxID=312089 RepID=A0ABT4CQX0_9CLOT|nr:MarR family transcriptional regulator [Clostridium ganghwense]MCY6371313.1 MarR family transcriptional regulator [Clostridium ganghwense]
MSNIDFERMIKNMFGINSIMKRKLMNPEVFLKDTNITLSHLRILFMLFYNTDLSVSQISKDTFISKPNCSKAIDILIKSGLANRNHDENDRRIIKISLTEAGKSFVKKKKKEIIMHMKNQLIELDNADIITLNNAAEDFYRIVSKLK